MTSAKPRLPCAIYTRKSSEEGLDQSFNSLEAQRLACEAYIKSQASEGWIAVRGNYDDGGFSGGTMERPALKSLLEEIERGQVKVIVVYKIDRLTRSLADFARIIEILDRHGASFVSVTQQFNTTTSMGRLTLNVLLSFAQFEREITGERIRDKIAASKTKGLWMGGVPPLGYRPNGRSLEVVPEEAETVRMIFRRYLQAKSVAPLVQKLKQEGIKTRRWISKKGIQHGGTLYSRGAIYHLLRNRLYLGEIVHKDHSYAGQHQAIVDLATWNKAQNLLNENAVEQSAASGKPIASALKGKLFDSKGQRMTPTQTYKKGPRRYRYYVSQALLRSEPDKAGEIGRVPAKALEQLVAQQLRDRSIDQLGSIEKIQVYANRIEIKIKAALTNGAQPIHCASGFGDELISVPVSFHRRNHATRIHINGVSVQPDPAQIDKTLVNALTRAYSWRRALEEGDVLTVNEIARREKVTPRYIRKLLPLAFLDPHLTERILDGRQPRRLSLSHLVEVELSLIWSEQRAYFARFEA